MFAKKLFDPNIEPQCRYCENAAETSDKQAMLCKKKGVMTHDYFCSKFIYDPLKRQPTTLPRLRRYEPEDFSI